MTEKDKDILIEKMLDRPDSLSASDIEAIMADEELRELYGASVMLADTLQPQPAIDGDREWELFSRRLAASKPQLAAESQSEMAVAPKAKRKRPMLNRIVRVAAVLAGVLLLSAVIISMLNGPVVDDTLMVASNVADTKPVEHIADAAVAAQATVPAVEEVSAEQPEVAPTQAVNPAPQPVEHAEAITDGLPDDFDIDEYIAIRQARIDNEVAMAMAQVYEAEYRAYLDVAGQEPEYESVPDDAPALTRSFNPEIDQLIML